MVRIKSQIAEDFATLLENAGMFKEAYPSLEAYKNDLEARVGSDSISTIEALYGVKPEGQDYDHCIMENAHPTSVIIAPSYDKLNGLVENNMERANIMHNIVLKPNTGNHTNPKYAHQELVMELIRVANEMDNKNKEDLFKLADDCLIGLHKQAFSMDEITQWFKEKGRDAGSVGKGVLGGAAAGAAAAALLGAWSGPGEIGFIPAGALVGGLIAAFTKTAPQVKNIEENAHEVSTQLKDLYSITEQKPFFDEIEKVLQDLIASSRQYQDILNSMNAHAIKGGGDVGAAGASGEDAELHKAGEIAKTFLKDVETMKKYHQEFNRRAKSGAFAKAEPSKLLTPVYWFMDDNIEDVSDAFDSLEDAVVKLQLAVKEHTTEAAAEHSGAGAGSAGPAPAGSVGGSVPAPGDVGGSAKNKGLDVDKFLGNLPKLY